MVLSTQKTRLKKSTQKLQNHLLTSRKDMSIPPLGIVITMNCSQTIFFKCLVLQNLYYQLTGGTLRASKSIIQIIMIVKSSFLHSDGTMVDICLKISQAPSTNQTLNSVRLETKVQGSHVLMYMYIHQFELVMKYTQETKK